MTPLGTAFSRVDALKRQLYDMLTNPRDAAAMLGGRIVESGQQAQALQEQTFGDPNRPFRVTDPQAMAKLTDMLMQGPMGFAPAGVIQKSPKPFTVAHGTKEPFTEFKSGMGRTAKDIYTVPEELVEDASMYGSTIIKATASPKKMIDFSDFDKLDDPTIKVIKKAAKDAGITDKYYTFDQFKDDLMSGQMYQVGGGPSAQNAFLAELFTKFDAVKMPDARVGGGLSQSVVFQNPQLLKVQSVNNVPIEDYTRQGLLD
jgi:hypothetical protein